jgi:hypothetical protein
MISSKINFNLLTILKSGIVKNWLKLINIYFNLNILVLRKILTHLNFNLKLLLIHISY